jgi:selenocysteine lyase/cysteine desulfurase
MLPSQTSTWSRRDFLRAGQALTITAALNRAYAHALPQQVATDEDFWRQVRLAFIRDPKILNLNNGGVAPAPTVVLDAEIEDIRYSNYSPSFRMWRELEPKIEDVRKKLAAMWDADPECVAITRNASESLENAQLGIDLKAGDEVLLTHQDYPRMITTWEQRVRRDGIVLRQLEYPVPVQAPQDLVRLFEQAITPKTRVLHFSQVVFMTGQIFPVKELCALARSRGLISIVDGAHAFAHVPFKFTDFDCDYYGASLHKWLSAPVGTGLLYVRKDRIPKTWALMAAPKEMDANIRKFEEIGTHPAAMHNGILQALEFHASLGSERKFARLRYLKQRWAERLGKLPGCKLCTRLEPNQSGAFSTVEFAGVDAGKLGGVLLDKYQILTTPIVGPGVRGGPGFQGLRICPNVYTSLQEIDRFCEAVEESVKGLRGSAS